jgi:DNA-directed RNA polymerase sigma subunit (sigma70/sigma32)
VDENERTQELADLTAKVVASITPREKQIILEHMREGKTLREIGKELGIWRENQAD